PPSRATVAALLGHPVAVLSERPVPRLTRLLVNVTVGRSLWPVHVVLGVDATVADLARATVAAYITEGRRAPLPADANDVDAAARFELHLSFISSPVLMCSSIPAIPRSPPPLVMCGTSEDDQILGEYWKESEYYFAQIRCKYLFLELDYWIVFAPKTDVVPYLMPSVMSAQKKAISFEGHFLYSKVE
ncbi:uncharacterized protein LOC124647313, partial [Lolium rigidum]|uniref:uncharacterized protein LOC124647313 n=1 Tax=Lolium rigidum TaxID=89674 RepID=UPI001F5C91F6